MELVKHTWEIIRKYDLFRPGQTIIIGLSGGPDSVTLAHVLHQIKMRYKPGWRLIIAHLNHMLRGKKADADENFARKMALKMEIPFYSARKNILAIAKKQKQSMEETARLERYQFFDEIARKVRPRRYDVSIAVGHNLDDNAETVLFRIIRGTGLKGLRGILSRRKLPARPDARLNELQFGQDSSPSGRYDKSPFWLVRPLIYVKRKEIIEYLTKENLRFRTDATNKNLDILRNRIRHELLPILNEYNPSIAEHLVQLSESAAEYYDYIDNSAQALMPKRASFLSIKALRKEHPVIQIELINRLLDRNHCSVKKITFAHYYALKRMIYLKHKYSELHLPERVTAIIKGDRFTVKKSSSAVLL